MPANENEINKNNKKKKTENKTYFRIDNNYMVRYNNTA